VTLRLEPGLYDRLVTECSRTKRTQSEVLRGALESALSNGATPPEVMAPDPAVSGTARIRAPRPESYVEESVASPCCGADIQVSEGRRFCSDCGTLVPS
jgi:hypothetical protein